MRELTMAWAELGDPYRRRLYDTSLKRAAAAEPVAEPQSSWRPYDDGDDIVDDRLDDSHLAPPRGGRALAMVPPVVLASGVLLLVLGLALTSRAVVAVGAIGVLLGAALFVLASLSAVMESRHHDLH